MKKIFSLILVSMVSTAAFGNTVENELYFRAMKDEMNRTLKELRLPGEQRLYYVAYYLRETYEQKTEASLGELYATFYRPFPDFSVNSFIKIGNDKNNNTGYYNHKRSWDNDPTYNTPLSYEGIRQDLWRNTNEHYLQAIEQYKEKEAYRRKKNIKEPKPDVVPAPQATYMEAIPAWEPVDLEPLNRWVQEMSARGKEISFLEDFRVLLSQWQNNTYYLNSRGAKVQWAFREYQCKLSAVFRQPDGYEERLFSEILLKDFSAPELARAEEEVQRFLTKAQALYGAPEAEIYLGPVLYKPSAVGKLLRLEEWLNNPVPWWSADGGEDTSVGLWRKKIGQRVMSPGIIVYDRPNARYYNGVELPFFNPVDQEGVRAKNLTIISGGKLQEVPLSQRPLELKNHQSNGHASLMDDGYVREGITTIFVEPDQPLTDEQMEEKLRARCKELDLPYCYIKEGSFFQRVYTQDGRKEWVLGLQECNLTDRSLRDILAAGGEQKLVQERLITPSLLVDEVELEPQDRHPGRKPLIEKPQ